MCEHDVHSMETSLPQKYYEMLSPFVENFYFKLFKKNQTVFEWMGN